MRDIRAGGGKKAKQKPPVQDKHTTSGSRPLARVVRVRAQRAADARHHPDVQPAHKPVAPDTFKKRQQDARHHPDVVDHHTPADPTASGRVKPGQFGPNEYEKRHPDKGFTVQGVVEAQGLGIPVSLIRHPIREINKMHDSVDLQKVANPEDAMPLVAGFAQGGPHFKPSDPGLPALPKRSLKESRALGQKQKSVAQIDKEMKNSPLREQAHQHFDNTSSGPAEAWALKNSWDARVHDLALEHAHNPGAIKQISESLKTPHPDGPGVGAVSQGDLYHEHNGGVSPVTVKHYTNTAAKLLKTTKAAPENAGTRARMRDLLLNLRSRAIEAEQFKHWYEQSSAAIMKHVGGNIDEAIKLSKLLAIYSPRAAVYDETSWNNLTRSMGAYDDYQKTKTVSNEWSLSKNSTPDWQTQAAQAALDGTGDWTGLKTNSFYSNFLEHIAPTKHEAEFGPSHVTIDTWMRRAFGYVAGKSKSGKLLEPISKGKYKFMEDATVAIAHELGWSPQQAQAAIWTSIKAEQEGTPLSQAGIDFSHALAKHGERAAGDAAIAKLDLNSPPTGQPHGAPADQALPAFLRRVTAEAYGSKRPTAKMISATEKEIGKLPAGHPIADHYDAIRGEQPPAADPLFGHEPVRAEPQQVSEAYVAQRGTDLEGLPSSAKYKGAEIEIHSNAGAQHLAEDYMREAGLPYEPPKTYAKVDVARAKKIATWYDGALDAPTDPATVASYDAMIKETLAQHDAITGAGYTFEFYPEGHDPYPGGPREAMADLQENKHMYVFPTEGGFGSGAEAAATHPLLGDSGLVWGGKSVTHNDVFRAVHDFFGHFKEGVGFRAAGEENAWRSHSAMYSEAARPAMTSETRGQNSWVNYGPHGEANRTASQATTVYADQKAVLAPDWVVKDGAGDGAVPTVADLAPRDSTGQDFGTDAASALEESASAARDIATLLPEAEWPPWVRNQIRTQAVGHDEPIDLPSPSSPLDEAQGPTQRYMEFLAGKGTPDSFPGSWVKNIRPMDKGLGSGFQIGFEIGDGEKGLLQRGEYKPHHEQLNDLSQQVRKPRSRLTFNLMYKPIWAASRRLEKSEWVRTHAGVRLLTAGERIMKQAGRDVRKDIGRAPAAVYDELHTVAKIKEGSAEDIANHYYWQLPAKYRNAKGLHLVQDMQKQTIEYITSGEAEKDLQAWAAEAKAGDTFEGLQANEKIDEIRADLEQRVTSASASVAKLDELIKDPPAFDEKGFKAASKLMDDREQILSDAGRLDSGRGESRRGQFATQLGLEPDGTEIYIGHRLPEPDPSGTFQSAVGGVGRVASPKGVGSKNSFVLASTGRQRPTTHVVLEDWQSAQVFREAMTARETLSKAGTPFAPGKVTKDDMIVNPRGRTIPKAWKTEELSQFVDGHEDSAALRKAAEEITSEFLLDPADADYGARLESWKRDMAEAGIPFDDLRIVPKRRVGSFYRQFKAGGRKTTGARVYDGVVDAVATSIVFARVGYIPKNLAQNIIMMVPHQGPMLLVNSARAAQVMRDAELRHLVHAEIGFSGPMAGLSRAGTSNIVHGVFSKIASGVGKVADDPARFSAFLHEAAAEGVISKVNPLLTEKDRASLLDLLKNPKQREKLNDISARATEAMADFSRMTPDQAKMARRLLVVPGWLMAGSRYPFHFALNHPIRSALLAYIAMGEPGAPDSLQFNKPINEYFAKGMPSFLQGIPVAGKLFRTGSLNPVTTPWDIAGAVVNTAKTRKPFDYSQTAFDYMNPGLGAAMDLKDGRGLKKSLLRLAPNYSFVEGMIHPKASSYYPDDATRLGRLEREGGVWPIHVTAAGGKKVAKSSQQKSDAKEHSMEKSLGSPLPPEVVNALHTKATYHDAMEEHKKELGVTSLSPAQRTAVKLSIIEANTPALSQTVQTFKQSLGDPHVQASIDRWAETTLNWPLIDHFAKQARTIDAARKAAHG